MLTMRDSQIQFSFMRAQIAGGGGDGTEVELEKAA